MAKLAGNAFLVGTAFCFTACVVAFEAFLSTAYGDEVVSVVSSVVLAAGIPTVAYCVGLMVARGGVVTRIVLFGILQVFLGALSFCCTRTGFWAALSYSMLAAGIISLAKLADGTDERFHIAKSVLASLLSAFLRAVESDLASGFCFSFVFLLGATVLFFDLTVPRPGSLHAFVAGLYSSPPTEPAAAPLSADKVAISGR